AFYKNCHGKVIYKTLTQGWLGLAEQKGVFTSAVKSKHLKHLDKIRQAPCLFQEHIPKAFDLRVTIIGEHVFPVEIHSQRQIASRTDFRRGDVSRLKHVVHQLPKQIEKKCLALVRSLNLEYGAIDLIVTSEGSYVFLEINPSGQFGWIEGLTK